MSVDIIVHGGAWDRPNFQRMAEAACEATLHHIGVDPLICEISVMACDDVRIADLNAEFRGKAVPTNVLSWPAEDLAAEHRGEVPQRPSPDFTGVIELGDIAIAYETCAREACDLDKPMDEHLSHLVVHGTLHLLGYDHIDDADSALMQKIEAEILGKLGYHDPYS